MPVFQLSDALIFPPPQLAREDGLLAVGGDLSEERLLLAYRMGIFPWYSDGEPILWWAPTPRLVMRPENFRISKRLARTLRQDRLHVTFDTCFPRVIRECCAIRVESGDGTWLTEEMIAAYCGLHDSGYAHSVECWSGSELVGGLYGVSLGAIFYGESMFSRRPDSSKVALATLVKKLQQWEFELIDCQIVTGHLVRLGAETIGADAFYKILAACLRRPTRQGNWGIQHAANCLK